MDYIFDTHAHYDDEAFDADREEVLAGLKKPGSRNCCECRREHRIDKNNSGVS